MKHITIYQEHCQPLILEDNNNEELDIYTDKVKEILSFTNITKISVNNEVILIRPSKINSIKIKDIQNKNTRKLEDDNEENVITDGE